VWLPTTARLARRRPSTVGYEALPYTNSPYCPTFSDVGRIIYSKLGAFSSSTVQTSMRSKESLNLGSNKLVAEDSIRRMPARWIGRF